MSYTNRMVIGGGGILHKMILDYITFSTTGNASDFGDLLANLQDTLHPHQMLFEEYGQMWSKSCKHVLYNRLESQQ